MTGEEIKATKLTKLIQRLFVIDATLTKETSQLVTEYNEIIEEIWTILEGVELKTDPPKVLSLTWWINRYNANEKILERYRTDENGSSKDTTGDNNNS